MLWLMNKVSIGKIGKNILYLFRAKVKAGSNINLLPRCNKDKNKKIVTNGVLYLSV